MKIVNEIRDFFKMISKEMVTILWVAIVFLLILFSYFNNDLSSNNVKELGTYKISISLMN